MANEIRQRQIGLGGLIDDNPLTLGATTLNSTELGAIVGGVDSSHHLPITLDPDGVGGVPEIAWITAHTASATSATIARGMEGSTARSHVLNIPWRHAPTLSDFPRLVRKYRASTNLTANGTNWANLDTGLDITLVAGISDVIEVGINGLWSTENVEAVLDVVTVVGGSPVNSFGNQGAVTTAPPFYGIPAWRGHNSVYTDIGPPYHYTLVSGDLSSGTVTLRLRVRTSTASNKILYANTDWRLEFWAKNIGPEVH